MSILSSFAFSTSKIIIGWNFRSDDFGIFDLLGFVGAIQFFVYKIRRDSKGLKKGFWKWASAQVIFFAIFKFLSLIYSKFFKIFIFLCVFWIQRGRKHTSLLFLRFKICFCKFLFLRNFGIFCDYQPFRSLVISDFIFTFYLFEHNYWSGNLNAS